MTRLGDQVNPRLHLADLEPLGPKRADPTVVVGLWMRHRRSQLNASRGTLRAAVPSKADGEATPSFRIGNSRCALPALGWSRTKCRQGRLPWRSWQSSRHALP